MGLELTPTLQRHCRNHRRRPISKPFTHARTYVQAFSEKPRCTYTYGERASIADTGDSRSYILSSNMRSLTV